MYLSTAGIPKDILTRPNWSKLQVVDSVHSLSTQTLVHEPLTGRCRGRVQIARLLVGVNMPNRNTTKGKGGQRRSSSSSKNSKVTNQLCLLAALSQPSSLGAQAYGADTSKTTKELIYEYTDFFDWENTGTSPAHPIKSILYDPEQPLFPGHSSLGSSSDTLARLESCKVWVLPRAESGQNASKGFIALAGVAGIETGYATGTARLAAVQNTIVQPDFDVKWRKVLDYEASDVFGDTLFNPMSGTEGGLEAFRISCVEMDSGSPLPTGQKVQVMYTLRFACVQAVAGEAYRAEAGVSSWVERPTTALSKGFVVSALKTLRNVS